MYLPAIKRHIPDNVVCTFQAFLEFCYLVCRDIITDKTLSKLQDTLAWFHQHCKIFCTMGVRPNGFSLPHQHFLTHYEVLIQSFGAPNGLCMLITESKHIKAVKEPWRHSNKFKALGQMLLTNQHLDKLAAAAVDFEEHRMLKGSAAFSHFQYLHMILFPSHSISLLLN